ncbi:STAS domain-containing protein [Streptomyces sp. NPDC006475]|uniref:STAS domain-containing protein n=1 Tax=Streptomyces sp. NPDC006475 TaxID=3155719 RepID=UPI0033BB7E88
MTSTGNANQSDRLRVEHGVVDGVRVVTVQGEIDHAVTDVLREALHFEDGTPPPLRIVMDLSGVPFMDSSGINVLVAAYQQVNETQGWIRIAGAQESVVRLLELVGIDAVITCHPSIEQALSA